jgi:uncharacterized surface protein with fasciclin (FAS1) repeats
MSKINFPRVVFFLVLLAGIQACKKNNFSFQEQNRSVLMLDAMMQDTSMSITIQALEKANMAGTLNTYGPFTFFAPDNNAFRKFFANQGKTGLNDFTAEEIQTIMTYHILPTRLRAAEFIQGPQATPTGRGDYITLDISQGFKSNTIANGKARVFLTDLEYANGYLHKMDGVLDPPTLTIGQFLTQNPDKYSIMIGGLQRAGLMDTLTNLTNSNNVRIRVTLFAETNDVLQAAGIQTFDNMPLPDLVKLMRNHIITGPNFSGSYTKFTTAVPGLNVVSRWDSTILTLDREDWVYFNLAGNKLINDTISFSASDIIMRNGIIHNLDKPLVLNDGIKRTQIYHKFWENTNYAYGVPGVLSTSPPVANAGSGPWRWYREGQSATNHPRGENFLFMDPDGINDSLVTIVKNVRRGKYRIEINYKNGGSRGDYQLYHGTDPIGGIVDFRQGTLYEQKRVIGIYTFSTSGDKRLNFTCTRRGGINLEAMILTPEY